MRSLYRFKWPLVLLLFGFLVRIAGAWIKIMHWLYADEILLAGTSIMAAAILWLILQLVLTKKPGPDTDI